MKECVWLTPALVAQIEFLEWTGENRLHDTKFLYLPEDKRVRGAAGVTGIAVRFAPRSAATAARAQQQVPLAVVTTLRRLRSRADHLPQDQRIAHTVTGRVVVEVGEYVAAHCPPLSDPIGPPSQVRIAVRASVEMLIVRSM